MDEATGVWGKVEESEAFQAKEPNAKLDDAGHFLRRVYEKNKEAIDADPELQEHFKQRSKEFLFGVAERHFPSGLEALPGQVAESFQREERALSLKGARRNMSIRKQAEETLASLEGKDDSEILPGDPNTFAEISPNRDTPVGEYRDYLGRVINAQGVKGARKAGDIAESIEESSGATPSAAMLQLSLSEGWAGWDEFLELNKGDRIGSAIAAISGVMGESSVQSAKGAIGGGAAQVASMGNPIVGGSVMGAIAADSEFQATYLGELQQEIENRGGDVSAETIQGILADDEFNERVDKKAAIRAGTIGATEGVAGILSFGIGKKIAGDGLKSALFGVGAEAGVGGAAGSGGEFLARLFSGDEWNTPEARKDIVSEGVAELGQAGVGTVSEGARALLDPKSTASTEANAEPEPNTESKEAPDEQPQEPVAATPRGPEPKVLTSVLDELEGSEPLEDAGVNTPFELDEEVDSTPEVKPEISTVAESDTSEAVSETPADSSVDAVAPEVEPIGPTETVQTIPLDEGLELRIKQAEDGRVVVERVNTEIGETIPLEGSDQIFESVSDALDSLRDSLTEDQASQISESDTTESSQPEVDELLTWLKTNPIRAKKDIKTIGSVSRAEERGLRASELEQQRIADYRGAPTLREYAGKTKERLRGVFTVDAVQTPNIAAEYAYDQGWISAPTTDSLYEGIRDRLSDHRKDQIRTAEDAERVNQEFYETPERQALEFGNAVDSPMRKLSTKTDDLRVGDVLEIDGQEVTVSEVEFDGATLDGGARFGQQFVDSTENLGYDRKVSSAEDTQVDGAEISQEEADQQTAFLKERFSERGDVETAEQIEAVPSNVHHELARSRTELEAARRLAALFNRRLVGVKNLPANGAVSRLDNDHIYLNVDASRVELLIVAHELLHQMRQQDETLYQDLVESVQVDLDSYLAEQRPEHGDKSIDMQREEFLADYLSDRAADPAFWQSLAAKNPGVFERFVEYVREFLNQVRDRILSDRVGVERYLRDAAKANNALENAVLMFAARSKQIDSGILNAALDEAMPFADGFSPVSRKADQAYLSAVESGDMEAAQRMVDEAAKAAGFTVRAFHGSPRKLEGDRFDRSRIGETSGVFRDGFSFTTNEGKAGAYARGMDSGDVQVAWWVHEVNSILSSIPENSEAEIWGMPAWESQWDSGAMDSDEYSLADIPRAIREMADMIREAEPDAASRLDDLAQREPVKSEDPTLYGVFLKPNDPQEFNTTVESMAEDVWGVRATPENDVQINLEDGDTIYYIYNPNDIKSADPVTYDESGNVIPLSERFNEQTDDIRFADRKQKPNQQIFGQDIGRSDEIQSIVNEVRPEVQANYFDGEQPISQETTDQAFAVIEDIEAGIIDPSADLGADAAGQVLIGELWIYAQRMMIEGDSTLYNRIKGRANDLFKHEATKAGRVLNARQFTTTYLDETRSQVEEGKKELVDEILPGSDLAKRVEELQAKIDAQQIRIEELSAQEVETVTATVRNKRGKKRESLRQDAVKALNGGKNPGENLLAVADEFADFLDAASGGDFAFADVDLGNADKGDLIRRLLSDQAKTGRRKKGAFLRSLEKLGMPKEKAERAWDKVSEFSDRAKEAKKRDAESKGGKKAEPTAQEKALALLDAESKRLDAINEKARKISDSLLGRSTKKTRTKSKDPLAELVREGLQADTLLSREDLIKKGRKLGLTTDAASELANALEAERGNRKAKKTKRTTSKKTVDQRVKDLTDRYNDPEKRPGKKQDELSKLVQQVVRRKKETTRKEYDQRMKSIGAKPADSADLWNALQVAREERQEILRLHKEMREEERGTPEQQESKRIIANLAKSQSDTQDNRPGKKPKKSIVAELYQDMLGYGPARSRAGFLKELESVGVDSDTANRLYDLAQREKANRTKEAKARQSTRAVASSVPFIMREILNHPSLKLLGPEERLRMMAKLFEDRAGLSEVDARASAKTFDAILTKKWEEAATKLAEEMVTRRNAPWFKREPGEGKQTGSTKTAFDRLREAIRAGALDPRRRVLDDLAKDNGWVDLTDSENQTLAELDLKLSDPEITPFEDVRYKGQIIRIIHKSQLPEPLQKTLREFYLASIFSGVKTWALQTSVVFNLIARVGVIDPATATYGSLTGKGTRNLAAYFTALSRIGSYIKSALTDSAIAFTTGEVRGLQEEEILSATSGLQKVRDRAVEVLQNPASSTVQKGVAISRIMIASNRYFFRILSGLDNLFQGFNRAYTSELEAFSRAYGNGMTREKMKSLHAEVMAALPMFQEAADKKGFSGVDKQAYVNDRLQMALFAAFEGQGIDMEGVTQLGFDEAGLETGVVDFQTGMSPLGTLGKKMQEFSREGGVLATILVPVVRTPFQVFHRSAWYSPYGLARILYTGVKTKGFKEWKKSPYEQALMNPTQLMMRTAEGAIGTAVLGAMISAFADSLSDEEDEKEFRINLSGPTTANRTEYTAWRATGRRPFTVQFKVGESWLTMGFRKGGMEFLNLPLTLLGAWEQKEYSGISNSQSDAMKYVSTLTSEMTGESLFFLRGFSSRYSLSSNERTASQIGFMLSGFVWGASFLKTPNKVLDRQEAEDWKQAFAMQIPLYPFVNEHKPMLNGIGDPLGSNESERTYIQGKFGVPMGYVPFRKRESNGARAQDEDLYLMMFEKGYFPGATDRSRLGDISLEDYRLFTIRRGKLIKQHMKDNYNSLSTASPADFYENVKNAATAATKSVKKRMGIP